MWEDEGQQDGLENEEEDEQGEGNQNEDTEEDIKTNSAQILVHELYTIFIFSLWLFARTLAFC